METPTDPAFVIAQECLKGAPVGEIATAILKAAEQEYHNEIEKNDPEDGYEVKQLVADTFEEITEQVCDYLLDDSQGKAALQAAKALINIEDVAQDVAEYLLDSRERDRDPYAYYGVSRSDFY